MLQNFFFFLHTFVHMSLFLLYAHFVFIFKRTLSSILPRSRLQKSHPWCGLQYIHDHYSFQKYFHAHQQLKIYELLPRATFQVQIVGPGIITKFINIPTHVHINYPQKFVKNFQYFSYNLNLINALLINNIIFCKNEKPKDIELEIFLSFVIEDSLHVYSFHLFIYIEYMQVCFKYQIYVQDVERRETQCKNIFQSDQTSKAVLQGITIMFKKKNTKNEPHVKQPIHSTIIYNHFKLVTRHKIVSFFPPNND